MGYLDKKGRILSQQENKLKIVIYYRDLPLALTSYISLDGHMSIIKDGVKQGAGHACPRATILMDRVSQIRDQERLDTLLSLLKDLAGNNQIVDYNCKKFTKKF